MVTRPEDARDGLTHGLSHTLIWMVEMLHEILQDRLLETEVPTRVTDTLRKQMYLGALFESGVGLLEDSTHNGENVLPHRFTLICLEIWCA